MTKKEDRLIGMNYMSLRISERRILKCREKSWESSGMKMNMMNENDYLKFGEARRSLGLNEHTTEGLMSYTMKMISVYFLAIILIRLWMKSRSLNPGSLLF